MFSFDEECNFRALQGPGIPVAHRWRANLLKFWSSGPRLTLVSCIRNAFVLSRQGTVCLKNNHNAPRPSEHPPVRRGKLSKRLGWIKGCKYKTSSWHLNGFHDGNNTGSTG